VTERGAIGAPPEAVTAGLEPDAPPEGQFPGGFQFAEYDRAVPHGGPDDAIARIMQRREKPVQRCGLDYSHTAWLNRIVHGVSSSPPDGRDRPAGPHSTRAGPGCLGLIVERHQRRH
jgi:hypothetical protein